jgi:hypothetical protein
MTAYDERALEAMVEQHTHNTLRVIDGLDERDLCAVQGDCGQPGVKCARHQQHLRCQAEIHGIYPPQPGAVLRIDTVEQGEKFLASLREQWGWSCEKERLVILAVADRAKARIEGVRRGSANPCGHTGHRVPPNVVDHLSADQHLERLRREWETATPWGCNSIEVTICAIEVLRPLLPERSS